MITPEQRQIVEDNITHYIRNHCVMSKHSLDIIQKMLDEDIAQAQEILELNAYVNELREVVNHTYASYNMSGRIGTVEALKAATALDKTPSKSLAAHNAAIEDEVIERCARKTETCAAYEYPRNEFSLQIRRMPRKYKEQDQ